MKIGPPVVQVSVLWLFLTLSMELGNMLQLPPDGMSGESKGEPAQATGCKAQSSQQGPLIHKAGKLLK